MITFKNTISAVIGSNAIVVADTGATVDAESTPNVSSTVVSFGGGLAGLNGSISVVSLGTGIDPTSAGQTSMDQSDVNNTLNPNVSGSFNTSGNSNDPSAAPNGDAAGLGSMLGSSADNNHLSVNLNADPTVTGGVTAAIANGASVTVTGGGVSVTANQAFVVNAIVGGVAIGLFVGFGASVTEVNITASTSASIGDNAIVSASKTGDVIVKLTFNDTTKAHAYGGQLALAAGGGESADITDSSTNSASIGDGVSIAQAGTVTVAATSSRLLSSDAVGATFGLVAIGAAEGTAKETGSTTATLGNNVAIGQGTGGSVSGLNVGASDSSVTTVNVLATSGGGRRSRARRLPRPTCP